MQTKVASPKGVVRIGLVLVIVLTLVLAVGLSVAQAKGPHLDCGKNPYRWNPIGGHYERQFSQFCELYTHDLNDVTYAHLWCNETPLYLEGKCGGP